MGTLYLRIAKYYWRITFPSKNSINRMKTARSRFRNTVTTKNSIKVPGHQFPQTEKDTIETLRFHRRFPNKNTNIKRIPIFREYLYVRNNEVRAQVSASGRIDIPHPADHHHNGFRCAGRLCGVIKQLTCNIYRLEEIDWIRLGDHVEGSRRRGRPKLRWEDRLKLYMKELFLSEDMTSDRNA
nr:hypothetical protein [Tanacetum cinerariifolium]